jgi:hypothetical protein
MTSTIRFAWLPALRDLRHVLPATAKGERTP